MLQKQAVDKATFKLLVQLCKAKPLESFTLGGGTALALHLGHRISIDLDFFCSSTFDSQKLIDDLRETYEISNITADRNSLSCNFYLDKTTVKVDVLRHNYGLLQPILQVEKIRILSLEDIAAMKLNALSNRGAKKDFFDFYTLLSVFSMTEMIRIFEKKYPDTNSFSVIKSLTYFDDAENQPNPISLIDLTWDQVKDKIKKSIEL